MSATVPIRIELPEQLVGERVIVRPWRESDARSLFDAIDESREHLEPWMPWVEANQNPDDTLAYVRGAHARWLTREDLAVAIVERDSGRVVGGSGLHRINWPLRTFEIGYWVAATCEGRGYTSETVQLLTRMCFDDLDANRVEIRMDTRNSRSERVAQRLGFVWEGTLRRALAAPDGAPVNVHVYALLPDEYAALPWATPHG